MNKDPQKEMDEIYILKAEKLYDMEHRGKEYNISIKGSPSEVSRLRDCQWTAADILLSINWWVGMTIMPSNRLK